MPLKVGLEGVGGQCQGRREKDEAGSLRAQPLGAGGGAAQRDSS